MVKSAGINLAQALRVKYRIITVAVIAISILGVNCGSHQSGQNDSKNEIRDGLKDLDSGDKAGAEKNFQDALEKDPHSCTARTALASIYVSDAGIELKHWLDPLLNASNQLESRFSKDSPNRQLEEAVVDKLTKDDSQLRELSNNLIEAISASEILLDLFRDVPRLNPVQSASLDRAVKTLRDESPDPAGRCRESRTYLAVISVIKLVNSLREVMIDPTTGDFSWVRTCDLDKQTVKSSVKDVTYSISILNEALVRAPSDPDDSQTRAFAQLSHFSAVFSKSDDAAQILNDVEGTDAKSVGSRAVALEYCNLFKAKIDK